MHFYICGNKKGVYDAYDKVKGKISLKHKILFFVDKDLSDFLGEQYPEDSRIFVTEYYSIENYLVTESVLRRLFEEIYYTGENRINFDVILEKFRKETRNFNSIILHVMAWVIYCTRKGHLPILNNIRLSNIYILNKDCEVNQGNELDLMRELEQRCQVTTQVEYEQDEDDILSELLAKEPKTYIRGKFELSFFIKFLLCVTTAMREVIDENGHSSKVRTLITENNAIEILGPRVDIPETLDLFLEENIANWH